ncbi:disulfide bond formation protein B [Rubellimicrobium sp. CFH 75288]|uniref:disulfide bond formation protein B n=1 Tax=Rubellimicrobium sp. CFH 75288 TaxID=2697034 RepID=UPI0014124D8D|nr:disulfide bond formation protein B [Rubellimicrobium sp. CFH 75288]
MPRGFLILLAAGGSLGLLAGAWYWQAMGYPPCPMCWWQRYPHVVAVALGLVAALTSGPVVPLLGALAAATSAGLGVLHTGVERGWWTVQTACTGGGLGNLSGADLLSLEGDRAVLCDQVTWEWLGLSMASWNAILSLGLVLVWLAAARTPRRSG